MLGFGNKNEEQQPVQQQGVEYEPPGAGVEGGDVSGWLGTQRLEELRNLALWELNPQDILEMLEHYYKGEAYDSAKQSWVIKFAGFMTAEGAAVLVAFVSKYVNKVSFLTHYTEEQIMERSLHARFALADWIALNYQEYKIDKKNFDMILLPTDSLINSALTKSKEGGERRFLGTVHSTTENTLRQQEQRKKFGIFK